ncbi:MAG: UDP-N-acetylmuramoyl-L-alanyl-D-glutamate--2,6-diaminopimelate ligase [Bdellovibrionaceae bacterium]|nr:UDP-N-acetylmuramoyl-L-alanyl-D-glutamate--2,6-diaminopimelate ligase [Pseudobdellovibrionaceae bacterium]
MKLQDLFTGHSGFTTKTGAELPDLDIKGLSSDARKVEPGFLFIAIKGSKADGHDFIVDAIGRGAVALVVQDGARVPDSFSGPVIISAEIRLLVDRLASRFWGDPSQKMFCVGVTGTNGKTSTTYLVETVLNAGHLPCGVIGTVNHHLGDKVWPSDMTTPDPIFLQKRLKEFQEDGAQAAALEVSSHALDQARADSVNFDVAVFTNLTRDHLDYHQDMESYFAAKQRLFLDLLHGTLKPKPRAIVNIGDEWGRKLRISDRAALWTYGASDADFRHQIIASEFTGTVFHVECPFGALDIDFPMPGDHNVQNAVAALAVGLAAGLDLEQAASALSKFHGVPGRLQAVPNMTGLHVFVDYAHSPDALENVLLTLRNIREGMGSPARIWVIFGCGGDRDRGKRPEMGRIAESLADQVVVTSDNPRTEDPNAIIADILGGLQQKTKAHSIVDRSAAIHFAIENAIPGDVILIAGKGHEDYQVVGTEKRPFRDAEVADTALRARGNS